MLRKEEDNYNHTLRLWFPIRFNFIFILVHILVHILIFIFVFTHINILVRNFIDIKVILVLVLILVILRLFYLLALPILIRLPCLDETLRGRLRIRRPLHRASGTLRRHTTGLDLGPFAIALVAGVAGTLQSSHCNYYICIYQLEKTSYSQWWNSPGWLFIFFCRILFFIRRSVVFNVCIDKIAEYEVEVKAIFEEDIRKIEISVQR